MGGGARRFSGCGRNFKKPNPFPQSIYDNVAFGPRALKMKVTSLNYVIEQSLRDRALCDDVKDNLKCPALDLSLGQQQRLCIARVLAVKPEVILMDEPCSALDPIATLKIEDLMQELASRSTPSSSSRTKTCSRPRVASDFTGFFWLGELVEHGETKRLFVKPQQKQTEDYITGRFG